MIADKGVLTPGKLTFPVEGELSIYAAASLKTALLDALKNSSALTVELAGVTVMDSAGLQVLVMLKREAERQGKSLVLAGHSEAVLKVLDLTNLAGFFGDPLILFSSNPD